MNAKRGWDRIRLRPSAEYEGEGEAVLFLGNQQAADIVIAHLPAMVLTRRAISDDPHWSLFLDAMADINGRCGSGRIVTVETETETWEHCYAGTN